MPHVPRGFSPTFGDPPDRPATEAGGKTDSKPARQRFGVSKLAVRKWQPDLDGLIETMLGKEFKADGDTGHLVRAGGA